MCVFTNVNVVHKHAIEDDFTFHFILSSMFSSIKYENIHSKIDTTLFQVFLAQLYSICTLPLLNFLDQFENI